VPGTHTSFKAVFSNALSPIVSRDFGNALIASLKLPADFIVCTLTSRSQLHVRGGQCMKDGTK
jgi:hypothetical protein